MKISASKHRIRVGFKGLAANKDSHVLDPEYGIMAKNVVFSKGALTGEIGLDVAHASGIGELPSLQDGSFKNVFHYRRNENGVNMDRLVAQLSDGRVFHTLLAGGEEWQEYPALELTGEVSAVNYNFNDKDQLLICSEEEGMYIIDGEQIYGNADAPHFTSIAVYNERVFGAINEPSPQVWFSDDMDPHNWQVSPEEAGYIGFNDELGRVIKVIAFNGYLFIFRDFGIYRLTAYGEQTDFVLKKVFTDTGRIYKHSIEMCGDRIVFFADKGLYSFDGFTATRIAQEFPEIIPSENMCASYIDGSYSLACSLESKQNNDCIISYNLLEKSISILGDLDATGMRAVRAMGGSQLLVMLRGEGRLYAMSKSGKLVDTPLKKLYVSPLLPAEGAIKSVLTASIASKYPIEFVVVIDGKPFGYKVEGRNSTQKVFIERSGVDIYFEIRSDEEKLFIAPLRVEVEFI